MENQANQGIKALFYAILAFLILIYMLNFEAIHKSLGGFNFLFFSVLILGIWYVATSEVKSIRYEDDTFKIFYSKYLKPKIVTIKKEEIVKISFHGKEGRYDNYWIKFHLKNGFPKRFTLYFDSKYIFTLMDKIKEKGFIVEYE